MSVIRRQFGSGERVWYSAQSRTILAFPQRGPGCARPWDIAKTEVMYSSSNSANATGNPPLLPMNGCPATGPRDGASGALWLGSAGRRSLGVQGEVEARIRRWPQGNSAVLSPP